MTGVIIFFHALICILMVVVILMQSGRGGGLTEGFAPAESLFGAQTNAFMIKATTVVAIIFFVTCLSLAVLSSQKGKSIMPSKVAAPVVPLTETEFPKSEDVTEDILETIPSPEPLEKKL